MEVEEEEDAWKKTAIGQIKCFASNDDPSLVVIQVPFRHILKMRSIPINENESHEIIKDKDGNEVRFYPVVPLDEREKISQQTVRNVIEFLEHDEIDPLEPPPAPLPTPDLKLYVKQDWYYNYITKFDLKDVGRLANASNYMDIDPLCALACGMIASTCKGKTVEQVRTAWTLPELNPEEEAEVRRENAWLFPA